MAEAKGTFRDLTLLAIEAALLAGDILRQGFGTYFSTRSKTTRLDLVTEYDDKAEKAILDFLRSRSPGSSFLAEESGESGPSENGLTWIVDPLDGTVNYARQIPVFSVSIAAEQQGEIHSGVVYQPMSQELFVAEKKGGAFLNGKKLQVSGIQSLDEVILATGFPYNLKENPHRCIDHFTDILRTGIPIRRIGSAAVDFAYTAAGRFDGFFEVSLAPWDCAAGKLLLEEAGGKVSGWDGGAFDIRSRKPMLSTNGAIHAEMIALLTKKSR